jgi:hypothetical protein
MSMESGPGCWGRLRRDILRVFRRDHPAKTSLQTGILFVLQNRPAPMSLSEIAAETHAQMEETRLMLNQLISEERVRSSWDGASPYRVYSIIREPGGRIPGDRPAPY